MSGPITQNQIINPQMQLPTSFISRDQFIATMEALRFQMAEDMKNSDLLCQIFVSKEPVLYNNSLLVKAIMGLVRNSFPPDEEGHCEIEHWAYQLDFGRYSDDKEDAGMLYDRLCRESKPVNALGTVFKSKRFCFAPCPPGQRCECRDESNFLRP